MLVAPQAEAVCACWIEEVGCGEPMSRRRCVVSVFQSTIVGGLVDRHADSVPM